MSEEGFTSKYTVYYDPALNTYILRVYKNLFAPNAVTDYRLAIWGCNGFATVYPAAPGLTLFRRKFD